MASEPHKIRNACVEATAEGIRRHLPGGVGILARGVPALALATLAHLVLDLSGMVSLASGLAGTGLHEILLRMAHRG